MLPKTPSELRDRLISMFPGYVFVRDEYDLLDFTFRARLMDFTDYYGVNNSAFTDLQIKAFASLINEAVEAGGELENAFSTCFLEHLHQVHARKPLTTFLSKMARKKLHA